MCTEFPERSPISPSGAGSNHQPGARPALPDTPFNRRVVLKAAAGVLALSASGIGFVPDRQPSTAVAQEAEGTRARRFVPEEHGYTAADAARGTWVTFATEFPFWALGASWDLGVGLWPIVAVELSEDGETWSETVDMAASEERSTPVSGPERLFTPLIFTNGARWVRYQTIDNQRRPGEVAGLSFVYIDPTDGPWAEDVAPEPPAAPMARLMTAETLAPPEIVTRAQWGANENWRFDGNVEVAPLQYETVSHLLIHHTETTNRPVDVPNAIRSIYYYHAVELGWGDIGYNYLVDHNGRIYQGRYGGQDVVGHHAYDFATGSAGISTIGNFHSIAPSEAAMSAIVAICAWVGRDLDPLGSSNFHTAPNLPTIASHRDATTATCPGDGLWNLLPKIRLLVAQTLASNQLETGLPAGIVPGDRVRVQTDDGSPLNLRSTPAGSIVGSLADGALAWVIDGPEKLSTANWYRLQPQGPTIGWVSAEYLIVAPPQPDEGQIDEFPFGMNLQIVSSAYIRRAPGLASGIVATAAANAWGYVVEGAARMADGYTWYNVRVSGYGMGWMARSSLRAAPVEMPGNPVFAIGDTVEATATVNLRPRAGVAQPVMTTAPSGARFQVSQGPIAVTGAVWYGVYAAGRGGSWMVQDYLRVVGPPPPARFEIGDTFRVTSVTNLRSAASTAGSVLTTMAVGTAGTILGGPASASGYTWWNVRLANGTSGWCIDNWLVETSGTTTPSPTTTTPPPASGKFDLGDTARVTERLNLRSAASTSGAVVVILAVGTTGTVLAGPSTGSGYTWWRIQTSMGTGWAVQDWLTETDGGSTTTPPPPSTKFGIGNAFYVNATANLRSGAGTGNGVVRTLAVNEQGTIAGGPTQANGVWWWEVSVGGATGWADESALTAGSPPVTPGGRFVPGDSVRVTERANFRTGAGTTNSVITTLSVGATGTVLGGPATASGYTWWQLQTSAGTGWIIDDVLTSGGGTTTPAPSGFLAGTVVRVTSANVRLRSGSSTSSAILAVLQTGHQLTVVSGPTSGSGYNWYRVTSASAGTGYIAADFIARV